MKNEYEYIDMIEAEFTSSRKTRRFLVSTKMCAHLGAVKWFSRWRQYCFFPAEGTVFSQGCMQDIQDFIEQLMAERKK